MAVGDEDRGVSQPGADRVDHSDGCHRPHAVHDAQMIGRHQRRGIPTTACASVGVHVAGWIGIQAEDGREIHLARLGEREAIGLRAGQRLLVRVDLPLAELLDPHAGHEPLPDVMPPLPIELLVVNVKGVFVLGNEDSFRLPVPQERGGPLVTRLRIGVARLVAIEDETDHVAGMQLVELPLLVGD